MNDNMTASTILAIAEAIHLNSILTDSTPRERVAIPKPGPSRARVKKRKIVKASRKRNR
jgi:hypothetical protein